MPKENKGSILIIDDEDSIRESLSSFLEDYDYKVTTAVNAEDAVELVKKNHFDVAIVDLRLPEMSGEEFILASNSILPALKYLIYTGSTDYHLSDKMKQQDLSHINVLFKPLPNLDILVQYIEQMMI